MIAFLRGRVQDKSSYRVILDVGGVGYELFLSTNSLSRIPPNGEEAGLYTFLHVREDHLQLYGFSNPEEKELFEHLISISSVGPRLALALLSTFSTSVLKKAILTEDADLISTVPGIGKKTAQRIVLELKEKLALPELEVASPEEGSAYVEARKALVNLGFSLSEVKKAFKGFSLQENKSSPEEIIKHALKNLAGN